MIGVMMWRGGCSIGGVGGRGLRGGLLGGGFWERVCGGSGGGGVAVVDILVVGILIVLVVVGTV